MKVNEHPPSTNPGLHTDPEYNTEPPTRPEEQAPSETSLEGGGPSHPSTDDGEGSVFITDGEDGEASSKLWLHAALFLVTCVTTTFWGALYAGVTEWGEWWRGLAYSGPLMGILLTHEMGHYLAARRHGIRVSLPYFIPFPIGLGTLGAVISMKGPITSRNALVDVGAAGPLAGFVVAIVVIVIGLMGSPVKEIPLGTATTSEGNSILYMGLKFLVKGEVLPWGRRDVFMSPTAFAGWIGFLVTMINLIPLGQLDGGHVAFAYFGDGYDRFCRRLHRLLPLLGIAVVAYVTMDALQTVAPVTTTLAPPAYRLWPLTSLETAVQVGFFAGFPWLLWPALVLGLKRMSGGEYHPPVGPDPLTTKRRIIVLTVAMLFLLIFTPVPMRGL